MCEFCGYAGRCCVCGREYVALMTWKDGGGRAGDYVDPDKTTLPADTVPELPALVVKLPTRADVRPVRQHWHERAALVGAALAACMAWGAVLVWFFGVRK